MNENELGNALNLLSVLVGLQNLNENRQQTAYNDVYKANERQAQYLLGELDKRLTEQNSTLTEQTELLRKILKRLEEDNAENRRNKGA